MKKHYEINLLNRSQLPQMISLCSYLQEYIGSPQNNLPLSNTACSNEHLSQQKTKICNCDWNTHLSKKHYKEEYTSTNMLCEDGLSSLVTMLVLIY